MPLKIKDSLLNHTLIFVSIFSLFSCASHGPQETPNAQAVIPELYRDDSKYDAVLSNYERDVTLYKEIELTFSSSAVLMAPKMMDAYKERVQSLQGSNTRLDKNILPDEPDVLPVVVTFYTPSAAFAELDDKRIWNISMHYGNEWLTPFTMNSYKNKASLAPYFPLGSTWSKMYVVLFRIPHTRTSKASLEFPIVFSMHSGIAKADFYWR